MTKGNKVGFAYFKARAIAPCSAEVLKWNYWDGEHLLPVHSGYVKASLLVQGKDYSLMILTTKTPVIGLHLPTLAFVKQVNKSKQITIALQLLFLSKTEILISQLPDPYSSEVEVTYRFYLPGPLLIFKPILQKLIPNWFKQVYEEDEPLRIRRQRVLNAGFKDYQGMPYWFGSKPERHDYVCELPIKPSPGSPLLDHPFSE